MQLVKPTTLLIVFLISLIAPARAQPLTEVFKQVNRSVVVVRTTRHGASPETYGLTSTTNSLGSGAVISADGLIMTAAHVIQLADAIAVEFVGGYLVTAKVVASSETADVALIKIDEIPKDLAIGQLGDSDSIDVGQPVFVVGAPYGLSHTLTVGHISGRRQPKNMQDGIVPVEFLQTDAAINKGNSGGPMFTMDGKIVGIVSHIHSQSGGYQGLGFAATINMAKELLLERRAFWSGVESMPIAGELARALNVPQEMGLLVQRVANRSPGYYLGLQGGTIPVDVGEGEKFFIGGDIVLEVGGIRIEQRKTLNQDLNDRFNQLQDGSQFTVTVLRGGKIVTLVGTK